MRAPRKCSWCKYDPDDERHRDDPLEMHRVSIFGREFTLCHVCFSTFRGLMERLSALGHEYKRRGVRFGTQRGEARE